MARKKRSQANPKLTKVHARICDTCGGLWAGWRDDSYGEPKWFWPTDGTKATRLTDRQFADIEACMCDPDRGVESCQP